VPTQVYCDDASRFREVVHLGAPVGAVAGPAVDEDDGRLALAGILVTDLQAIGSFCAGDPRDGAGGAAGAGILSGGAFTAGVTSE
jgi:hypothetical protein